MHWRSVFAILLLPSAGCTALAGVDEFTKVDAIDADVAIDGSVVVDGSVVEDGRVTDSSPLEDTRTDSPITPPTDTATPPVDTAPSCPSVQTLYTKGGPTGLGIGPSDLYWGLNCGAMQTCPKAGCASGSTPVAGIPLTCTTGIASFGSSLYVVGPSSAIWSCTLPGCTSPKESKLPTDSFGIGGYRVLHADATGAYVHDQQISGTRYVAKIPAGGGASCSLGSLPADDVLGFAVVAGRVYVTYGSGGGVNFALGWFPIDCSGAAGGIQPFQSEREGLSNVVAQGTTLYWTEKNSIVKCDGPPSCSGAPFATGLDSHPRALASDASALYWLTANGIFSCPHSGCGAGPKRLSCEGCSSDYGSSARLAGLVVDGSSVFMSCPATGRVIRVAK